MAYKTLTGGLNLVIATPGTTNYADTMETSCFQKITDHDHTSGKGTAINTDALASLSVTAAKIAADAVTTAKILDANVTTAKLATDAVTTVKITDDNVTEAKIALSWTSWTPTLSASGSMTYGTTTINFAKYIELGNLIIIMLDVTGTVGGTPSTDLTFTTPTSVSANTTSFSTTVLDGGSALAGICNRNSSTTLYVRRYDSAVWSAGSGRRYIVSGFYEKL